MHQLKQKIIAVFFLATLLTLSACGWHLRGAEQIPEEFKTLYLDIANEKSDLARSLKRSLRSIKVDVKDNASEAPVTLKVSNIKNNRRTVSTSGRGKAAEYELISTITYQIKSRDGAVLYGPDSISVEKIYLFDPNRVVSAFEEEQILRQEMQRDLIRQLISRYQAAKTTAPPAAP